ncbi:mechanosensitive ion channel family protein [Nitrincola sp. MINF-07-Sa-05]|uniref:mechanosensitive ion channel family protein n=1 Tax=Nitrincola salilacus TaxID=3400273 RepID=UPI003917DDA0
MDSFFGVYVLPWLINIGMALLIFFIGRQVIKLLINVLSRMLRKAHLDEILVNFITSIVNALLLLIVVVAALGELGVDTTSLIALVGAAGLAIGLSMQDSLKNFAAGVMLIVFRPFRAGDFVEAAGISGVVENINIFTTMMRTGDNREILVPNGNIYAGVITNFSRRDTRRVDMVFGISYDDDLRKAKQILQDILANDERVLDDPAPVVVVASLGDSSVNFNVRPWVKSADYWDVLWDVTELVKLRFDEEGITIPYPQMALHLHREEQQADS